MWTNSIFIVLTLFLLLLLFIVSRKLFGVKSTKKKSSDQIYVGNLAYHVGENDLHAYFSRFGAVQAIKIVRNFHTGRSKGYGFVTYTSAKQAVKALDAHGKDLQGRSLVVRIAKSREQHAYT